MNDLNRDHLDDPIRWWEHGDHPEVGYYRHPPVDPITGRVSVESDAISMGHLRHADVPERYRDSGCGYYMHQHGWIDSPGGGHTICPGDWITTDEVGRAHPVGAMSISLWRKKPVVVEAVQWDGSHPSAGAIIQWLSEAEHEAQALTDASGGLFAIEIPTLEGPMSASPGDWIIKGVAGEFYPIKDSIFRETYERFYRE